MRARLALAAAVFIALGMPRSSWGVAWPAAASEFGRPLGQLGLLLAGFVVLYALATMLAGRLVVRLDAGRVIGGAAALGATGLLITALSTRWPLAAAGVGMVGISGGLIDAAVNTDVALHNGPRAMGMLHASYGVGATIGPLLVTLGLSRFDLWRPPFAIFAGIHVVIAVAVLSKTRLWSERTVAHHSPAPVEGHRRVVTFALLLFALITAVETTASQFGFSFLTIARGVTETSAGLAVAGFFAGLTVARLALGIAGHMIKPSLMVTCSTFGVAAGAALLWWSPAPLWGVAGLTVMGLGAGTLFPLNVLLTPQRVGSALTPRVVGWQLAAANFGGAVYPPIVGRLIGSSGAEVIGPAVMASAALLLVAAEMLRRTTKGYARGKPRSETEVELNAVAHLLAYMAIDPASANQKMAEAGYDGDQIAEALLEARGASYIEPSGQGMDQLTDLGRARGKEARDLLADLTGRSDLPE